MAGQDSNLIVFLVESPIVSFNALIHCIPRIIRKLLHCMMPEVLKFHYFIVLSRNMLSRNVSQMCFVNVSFIKSHVCIRLCPVVRVAEWIHCIKTNFTTIRIQQLSTCL